MKSLQVEKEMLQVSEEEEAEEVNFQDHLHKEEIHQIDKEEPDPAFN